MANLIRNNFNTPKLKLNYEEYWDFYLNRDNIENYYFDYNRMYDGCLIAFIDAELPECKFNDWLYSVDSYKWDGAVNNGEVLYNVGMTGVDNGLYDVNHNEENHGLIRWRRDRINNYQFVDLYTKSTYTIDENDYRLKLHAVSGATTLYEYPMHVLEDSIKLNGGFYQGFFKTSCDTYDVLPSKIDNGDTWEMEFVLKKTEFEKESNRTLNDYHPNNKGIFFYIGTRAENKWIYLYKDEECDMLDLSDFIEDDETIGSPTNNFTDMSMDFNEDCRDSFSSAEYINSEVKTEDAFKLEDIKRFKLNNSNISDINEQLNNYLDISPYRRSITNIVEDDLYYYIQDYKKVKKFVSERDTDQDFVINQTLFCNELDKKKNSEYILFDDRFRALSIYPNLVINEMALYKYNLMEKECNHENDDYDYEDTEYFEDDLDLSDYLFLTSNGLALDESNQYQFTTDNKFLMFNRTCTGYTVSNYEEGDTVTYQGVNYDFDGNLFLLMNRTCTGYTVNTIDTLRESKKKEYNIYEDIIDNALAFIITDDGKIGYRYYTLDCEREDKFYCHEAYSLPNIVSEDEWHTIHVKFEFGAETMVLKFYVDGYLVFVSNELRKLNLRELKEIAEKQETVPFNISLGGGTQGLCETILPDYMRDPYRKYPLEVNFAGTFIGYLKSFKFYDCYVEYMNIKSNHQYEINRINKKTEI